MGSMVTVSETKVTATVPRIVQMLQESLCQCQVSGQALDGEAGFSVTPQSGWSGRRHVDASGSPGSVRRWQDGQVVDLPCHFAPGSHSEDNLLHGHRRWGSYPAPETLREKTRYWRLRQRIHLCQQRDCPYGPHNDRHVRFA